MTALETMFASASFDQGVLVCPDGESRAHLVHASRLPSGRLVRVGTAGMIWAGGGPDARGPRRLVVMHASEVLDGPPAWDESWTVVASAALTVHDLDGARFGAITPGPGTYLCRSRLVAGSEQPGHPWYEPDGWILEIVMLDPRTGSPSLSRWWEV